MIVAFPQNIAGISIDVTKHFECMGESDIHNTYSIAYTLKEIRDLLDCFLKIQSISFEIVAEATKLFS